jgi:hypothetical protein
MKAKDYLRQLELLDTKINQKIQQVSELQQMAGASGAIDYSRDRVQSSPSGDALSNAVIRYVSLENEIDQQIDSFVDMKNTIINQIQGLNNVNHVRILFKKYVEFKRLEVIAVEMNYTYQYTKELHGYALADFQRTYTNLLSNMI